MAWCGGALLLVLTPGSRPPKHTKPRPQDSQRPTGLCELGRCQYVPGIEGRLDMLGKRKRDEHDLNIEWRSMKIWKTRTFTILRIEWIIQLIIWSSGKYVRTGKIKRSMHILFISSIIRKKNDVARSDSKQMNQQKPRWNDNCHASHRANALVRIARVGVQAGASGDHGLAGQTSFDGAHGDEIRRIFVGTHIAEAKGLTQVALKWAKNIFLQVFE